MANKKAKHDAQIPLPGVQPTLEANQGPRPKGMPSLAVLKTETTRLGLVDSDAEDLYDRWLANGFRTKTGPIKDWKAAVRVWFRNGWFPSQKKRRSTVIDDQQAERRQKQFQRIKDGSN